MSLFCTLLLPTPSVYLLSEEDSIASLLTRELTQATVPSIHTVSTAFSWPFIHPCNIYLKGYFVYNDSGSGQNQHLTGDTAGTQNAMEWVQNRQSQ